MLCMGKKQVPVMLRNPTEQFKTLKKDFQMGIGLEINAVMEETDENSLKLNKIDITPKQSFGLNQLREKLPTHLKELFNRSLANLNNQQSLQLATLLLKFQDIFAKDDLDIGLFNGDIQHKIDTGNSHPIKQKMRRTPLGFEKEEEETLTAIKEIWSFVNKSVPLTIRRLVDDGSYNTNWTPSYSPVELHEEQMKDSDLKTLKRWIEVKYEPTKAELKLCSEVVRHFWSLRQQIQIKDNILLYKWEDPISPRLLFMTPKQMQKELLHGCHDVVSSGHMGQYKTLEKLKQIAVWLNMTQSRKLYVKSCTTCNLNKKSTRTARSKLGQYHAGFPMERVHMDILGPLPVTKTESKYLLMVIDQYTKWLECFPIATQTAEVVARTLVDHFFSRFGCPIELHTDQGKNMDGNLVRQLCELLQITNITTKNATNVYSII
ncbi:Hypothetical predicted protein [Mytilus galloprovincialis]|uniref:Integrase catalytic domain-containing protein n=1 Tax=Mytilus galloprovincialis TaxID=29158 RepID=A0A8B6FI66_MYTGA|nr:Hypothetical predicted protein [Mytilus galloprovincialis]